MLKNKLVVCICALLLSVCGLFMLTACDTGSNVVNSSSNCHHQYEPQKEAIEATCEQMGVETLTCMQCGDEQYHFIPAQGHDWVEEEILTEATQNHKGLKTETCTLCEETRLVYIEWEEPEQSLTGYVFVYDGDYNQSNDVAIQGVTVSLYTLNDELVTSAVTDYNGAYTLSAKSGNYRAVYAMQGYTTVTETVVIYQDDTINPSFAERVYLEEDVVTTTVSGYLHAFDGDNDISNDVAISGAMVAIATSVEADVAVDDTTTDANGYFELNVPNGIYVIGFYLPGYEMLFKDISVGSNEYPLDEITYLQPAQAGDLSSTVYATDTDQDPTNNTVLANVAINVYFSDSTPVSSTIYTDSYGDFTLELSAGVYVVTFELDGYVSLTLPLTVGTNEYPLPDAIYLDIDQASVLSGRVLEADTDNDISNNSVLAYAEVSIEKQSGTGEYTASTTTDGSGNYSFSDLPAGTYKLSVFKEGYLVSEQFVNIEANHTTVQNMALEVIREPEAGVLAFGSASGTIIDAAQQGNVPLEGLTLNVRAGLNNTVDEILETLTTGADGGYTLTNFPAGNYTIQIIDNRVLDDETQRYTEGYFNIKIIPGETIENQNNATSNNANDATDIQIKLYWGTSVADLDSHLTGPTNSSDRFHIAYYAMSYNDVKMLDRDDQDGEGPETTTIDLTLNAEGVYRFSVHNYTGRNSSNSNSLANSGAYVEVRIGGELKNTFYVPNEYGTLWTVFEYDSNTGVITQINEMSYESTSSNIQ